ncbi:TonB-dependent siderophore receptor [Desulforhopalus sp. IMCC35007]|uniref:TonB-dependent receptor plug domain-containing protein n=1 Tax=Desulforhopalus sp. IMCC35007 TaxID=2569543 RepID=UPI00145FB52C|nr:TonB-dependent receptor [Desulforhopalus sp. IMCC35007]
MKKTLLSQLCVCTTCIITSLPINLRAQGGVGENEYIDMDLTQLMNITITSVSKKPQSLADAAAAVYVISAEDIKNSGVTSVAHALAMAPGLQVAQLSASKWSISSRGFSGYTSNKLLVLIDGRSVYTPVYSGTLWDENTVLLEDVARIEVIRGPGGTLWGSNAVNGVINIITKKAEDTQGVMLTAGGGTQERVLGAARIGEKFGESTYGRLSVSYNDREENSLYDGDTDAGDGWESMRGSVRLDGEPSKKVKWTLQSDLYKNNEDQFISPYWITTPPYLSSKNGSIDDEGADILGKYEYTFSPDKILTIQSYYDYTDRADDFYQQTVDIFDLDLQYQMGLGKINSLTMGSGFRQTRADFSDTNQIALTDTTDDLYSAFLQDEITLVPETLWFTLGTKWEHNDYTGSEWQPSARLLYKPAVNHSLWTSVARAVRTPSMVEDQSKVVLAVIPTEMGVIQSSLVGNDEFSSEELIAYEAGYRWQSSLDFSLDLSVFYNDYDDIYTVAFEPPATGYDLTFVNGVKGNSHGLEAVFDWIPVDWVSFQLVYSYLDMSFQVKDGFDTPSSRAVTDFVENSSPQHQASLRSTFNLGKDLKLNLWFRYVDEIVVRNSEDILGGGLPIDDYVAFDANIIWSVSENIEIMLAGQNLFEDRQLQYASEYTTPPTAIERGFYGKVTWKF